LVPSCGCSIERAVKQVLEFGEIGYGFEVRSSYIIRRTEQLRASP